MKIMDQVEEFIEEKIRPITKKQDINPQELQTLGEAIDIIKDIETIKAMNGYIDQSGKYGRMYADMEYDPSERVQYGARGRMMGGRYGSSEHMIKKLEHMMHEAETDKERQVIEDCISRLERM